jgi:tetratricopeptide (TPR) repeat protein
MTPERHRRSRACLEQAVADDPDYANGWAVLSTVYSVEHRQGFLPGPGEYDPLARSLEYARRAVTLDAGNATAHGTLAVARFHLHDLEAFKSECERARELNPSDSDTLARCGMRLAFMGDWDRGLASMKTAMELNPEHYGSYHVPFALHHYERGEYERALEQVRNMKLPRFFWSQMIRGMALGQLDRRDEAQAAVQKLVELKPGIREEFWGITRDWNFPDPLVERFADGLRKAGLDLAPRPADLGS